MASSTGFVFTIFEEYFLATEQSSIVRRSDRTRLRSHLFNLGLDLSRNQICDSDFTALSNGGR